MANRTLSIRGAREHNLDGLDLDLPLGGLIALTGPSGSGKSSLAFDTLHAEGQRRYLEALAAGGRRKGRGLRRPRVDQIDGLPPTIALDQRFTKPSRRATVATYAELHALLRLLFSRAGTQHCPTCDRPVLPQTHDEIVAAIFERPRGARLVLQAPVAVGRGVLDEIARAGFSRVSVRGTVQRLEEVARGSLDDEADLRVVVDRIRLEPDRRGRVSDAVRTAAKAGKGVVVACFEDEALTFVDRPYCWHCDRTLPPLEPGLFSFYSAAGRCETCQGLGFEEVSGVVCADCDGTRLGPAARAVRWEGENLPALLSRTAATLADEAADWPADPVLDVIAQELRARLSVVVELGLGHLALDRAVGGVSSGEYQRLRLAGQVGARLSGVLYVLDEPAAGLGDQPVQAVIAVMRALCAAGNTVIAVAHHPEVVAAADLVIDFGPGAGAEGGRVVYRGPPAGLLESETVTGRWFAGAEHLTAPGARQPRGWVRAEGVSAGNLRTVDVALPLGVLAAIHGPSGSGKSSLLSTFRAHLEASLGKDVGVLPALRQWQGAPGLRRLAVVDRAGLARSPRSNPATYVGIWNVLRDLLAATREAQVRGLRPGFFSLNIKGGRCEVCKGTGLQRVDLDWLPDVWLTCEVCAGRRFNADVLEVRWKGRAPDELLAMRVQEAHAFLAGHPRIENALRALLDVGLGYVPLGQAVHTLSGGEAQRLMLARELARASRRGGAGVLYLLDDPTVGLHPADVAILLRLFHRLVDEGATVWLATHDAALASACHHRIVLGPGAGPEGGGRYFLLQAVDNSGEFRGEA